ncbi:50S ribosomal protein L5 [Aureliella helgolandensis]|uniref:Large ribosomal subunit protein uL5 n=1 Tax=Aureliella helgolandensis TaxID=2527968 RepID=A0A518G1Z5_9BACT|nr:50S ribosomal protein L5 [Aureliella helgolandensis]QDV22633.1 50S ribosomal protein L5 [Aureliella helgolandensis]
MAPRLQERYLDEIRQQLAEQLGIENPMAIPRVTKIIINMGVGSAVADKKNLELAFDAMTDIAGQRPVQTLARKSIAGFKLREGMPIGCKVTLRRQRMYEFLDRLISIVLPRVRDFRGVSRKAFDGSGNYSLSLTEQLVFPELNPDKYTKPQGMNITIVTSAKSNEHGLLLLEKFGMPFRAAQTPAGS